MSTALWHYTCDHGREGIGEFGVLLPGRSLAPDRMPSDYWPANFVWLTDLERPNRGALGLSSWWIRCDRTAHRYRVALADTITPWMRARRTVENPEFLEDIEGARPRHWYVSREPVVARWVPL